MTDATLFLLAIALIGLTIDRIPAPSKWRKRT